MGNGRTAVRVAINQKKSGSSALDAAHRAGAAIRPKSLPGVRRDRDRASAQALSHLPQKSQESRSSNCATQWITVITKFASGSAGVSAARVRRKAKRASPTALHAHRSDHHAYTCTVDHDQRLSTGTQHFSQISFDELKRHRLPRIRPGIHRQSSVLLRRLLPQREIPQRSTHGRFIALHHADVLRPVLLIFRIKLVDRRSVYLELVRLRQFSSDPCRLSIFLSRLSTARSPDIATRR